MAIYNLRREALEETNLTKTLTAKLQSYEDKNLLFWPV